MTTLKDLSLLIGRVLLGVILFAHGWQKFNDWTISGTTDAFRDMGVPSPELAATFATYFEMIAGALLILGLLVRFVGPILAIQMAGAYWYAHRDAGIFASDGGWEVVALIAAGGLLIAGAGAGRFSIDHLFVAPFQARRRQKKIEEAREKGLAVQHADGTVSYPADAAPVNNTQNAAAAPAAAAPAAAQQPAPAQQPSAAQTEQPAAQPLNQNKVADNDGHTVIADQAPTNNFKPEQR